MSAFHAAASLQTLAESPFSVKRSGPDTSLPACAEALSNPSHNWSYPTVLFPLDALKICQ